jgi:hypothetical protein
MARNPRKRGKMALYEVMGKGSAGKTLERLQPEKAPKEHPAPEAPAKEPPRKLSRWPMKPRIVQFNAGRVEFSMPYQIGIVILLGVLLVMVVAFRLGQMASVNSPASNEQGGQPPANAGRLEGPPTGTKKPPTKTVKGVSPDDKQKQTTLTSKGNNRIVIQTYAVRADLEPVKKYFAQFGIETRIIPINNGWFLVTEQKYENPRNPGTDGFLARQKIVELGAKYKAPPGYETFAPNLFKGAYGMKFED